MRKIFLAGLILALLLLAPMLLSAQNHRGVRQVHRAPQSTFRVAPPAVRFQHFNQFAGVGTLAVLPSYPSFSYSTSMTPLIPFWANPAYGASIYAGPVPVYSEPQTAPPAVSYEIQDLNNQVNRLTREVQRLRSELSSQTPATQPALPPPPQNQTVTPAGPAVPTVLVFRDGRRMEITNYAVVGQTLWIFDERNSSRIELSALDLETTRKVNLDNGVRFLPSR